VIFIGVTFPLDTLATACQIAELKEEIERLKLQVDKEREIKEDLELQLSASF